MEIYLLQIVIWHFWKPKANFKHLKQISSSHFIGSWPEGDTNVEEDDHKKQHVLIKFNNSSSAFEHIAQ